MRREKGTFSGEPEAKRPPRSACGSPLNALMIVLLVGCSTSSRSPFSKSTTPEPEPKPATEVVQKAIPVLDRTVSQHELNQLGVLYRDHCDVTGRPPTSAEDMQLQKTEVKLYHACREGGRYVVNWGTNMSNLSGGLLMVLAYEKDAPTKGGMVLMTDGQVRRMTVVEFQKAAKSR